jgi:hypothetical protein
MSNVYIAVYRPAVSSGWPVDFGDDPSFEASSAGGRITWGVCRPNVRNVLKRDDVVIFFATSAVAPYDYEFVSYATVALRIGHDEVWTADDYSEFRRYRNLIIAPDATGGFMHVEHEHFGHRKPRRDWLTRIIVREQRIAPKVQPCRLLTVSPMMLGLAWIWFASVKTM